jgi:hypothetical protein
MIIINFIQDTEVGIFARAKRLGHNPASPKLDVKACEKEDAETETITDSPT